ncbi:hypothetical protein ACR2XN_28130 [Klebsiella pneumoniae]
MNSTLDGSIIKQTLCDEDEACLTSQSTPLNNQSEESKSSESVTGKPEIVSEVKIEKLKLEQIGKRNGKKKQNRNGKIGINKNSNYAYVPNAPRKICENCSSSNHLTYACKKPVGSVLKSFYDCTVPLSRAEHSVRLTEYRTELPKYFGSVNRTEIIRFTIRYG